MKATEGRNNVKIYNLSAGKTLPDWLSSRRRRQLAKKDVDLRRRIELIQDFTMPDVSNCIKVSPDEKYIFATGTYKPRVKCFEVAALSLKFERCFDAEVVEFEILSEDYSKLVFLQQERYIEFHSQAGRWFRTRIPKFGRDLAYHYPSCDLYIAASGNEVYRLNLSQGRFLNPLITDSSSVNKCAFNKIHYLLMCGTENGKIEAWDPRSRHRVGNLDCTMHMIPDYALDLYQCSKKLAVTSLAFNDALIYGVGTQTGQVLLYDLRSDKPLLVKDHMDGYPIIDIDFHRRSDMVFSMSPKIVKVWDKNSGTPYTSIESEVEYNDLCIVPDTGMMYLAVESTKMQTYFIPSLGPAPKWCSHLDALIEELEEEDDTHVYDDYKFVTESELHQLGLHDLIGTNMLRAVMHGYYMDIRLYRKAKALANPFDFKEFVKRKVKEKISEKNKRNIDIKKLPNVNRELFEHIIESNAEKQGKSSESILTDERFSGLFCNEDFNVDKESAEFQLIKPVLSKLERKKKKHKEMLERKEKEAEENYQVTDSDTSDSDSIISVDKEQNSSSDDNLNTSGKVSEAKNENIKKRTKSSLLKADPNISLNFKSVDTLDDLERDSRKRKKMSINKRLLVEGESEPLNISFGNQEIMYSIKKPLKFERLRAQQEEHKWERKKFRRSAASLRGKLRMKASFSSL